MACSFGLHVSQIVPLHPALGSQRITEYPRIADYLLAFGGASIEPNPKWEL
jgi:hypothetical protein